MDEGRDMASEIAEMSAANQVAVRHSLPETADPAMSLVREIAMDIGKEVVAYVEVMYPQAIAATSSTFKLSLRNCIYNEIIAAMEGSDKGQSVERLNRRKQFRRWWLAQWRGIRKRESA
jgi:hypothetical protein